jgi:hypothetical protein
MKLNCGLNQYNLFEVSEVYPLFSIHVLANLPAHTRGHHEIADEKGIGQSR